MKAKIKDKKEVARDTLLVEFDLLGETVTFKPGQYFYVTLLQAPFKDNGQDPRHHFTISNSPNEKGKLSFTTRVRNTPFKNSLKQMQIGSEVQVDTVEGDFVLPAPVKPLVFIALGIGITPYISMLRYIREESLSHQVTLFYSDSDKESLVYLNELEKYEKENPNFKMIVTVTRDSDWQGEKRHIDGRLIEEYLVNPEEHIYFVSGPPQAVESVGNSLLGAGIGRENINLEDFSGY